MGLVILRIVEALLVAFEVMAVGIFAGFFAWFGILAFVHFHWILLFFLEASVIGIFFALGGLHVIQLRRQARCSSRRR